MHVLKKCWNYTIDIKKQIRNLPQINEKYTKNLILLEKSLDCKIQFFKNIPDSDIDAVNVKINYYLKQGYNRPEAEKLARKVVAAPGTSEHNLGIAVDFNGVKDDFYKTEEYKWLTEHADEYGFILRYTKEKQNITKKIYEPWHFRYVGKEHAKAMKRMGLCLEEYIDFLKNQRLN
jgi:outer membrane receptor for Fe3+-dicitrate